MSTHISYGEVNSQNKTLLNNKGRTCIQLSYRWVLKEPFVFKCHHEWKETTVRVINTILSTTNVVPIPLFSFVEEKGEALLFRLAPAGGEDTIITNVDDYHNVFVTLRHQQPGTRKTLTSPHITHESV